MKVITIKQPWATLIAEGIKKYEFRSWKTNYRGDILIHAGAGIDASAMKKFKDLNLEYPSKKILAKVTITDCILLDKEMNKKISNENPLVYGTNDRDGYAWKLTNVEKLDIPDTINGKLGMWNYEVQESGIMFIDFEKYLKKNSNYIAMDRYLVIGGAFLYIAIIVSLEYHLYWNILIAAILYLILMYLESLMVNSGVKIKPSVASSAQEYDCIKAYLKDKNLYNKEVIKNFIDHYRMKIDNKNKIIDFVSFITLLQFLKEFFSNGVTPEQTAWLVIWIICYIAFISLIKFIKLAKGEYELYSRLEENFSELYAECINESLTEKK